MQTRKILIALLVLLCSGSMAFTQNIQGFNHHLHKAENLSSLMQQSAQYAANSHSLTESNHHVFIDYGTSSGDTSAFAWRVNNAYTCTDTLTLRYLSVAFDSLHDDSTGGRVLMPGESITVDTIRYPVGHINTSGNTNMIITSIVTLDTVPTNTVLWSDTVSTTTSLTTGGWLNFGFLTLVPNFTLPVGQKFGVRVDYVGPTTDTFGIISTYWDPCGGTCGGQLSSFFPNSFYYFNFPGLCQEFPPAGSLGLILDCNGNQQFDNSNCEAYYLQNHWVTVDLTINPAAPSCSAPGQTWTDRITPTSARLQWAAATGATSYQIRGHVAGSPNWVTLNVPASPTRRGVQGLNNNTTYEWQIRTDCNGTWSSWSPLTSFTTGCQMPDSNWTDNITTTTARLRWTQVFGSVGYGIRGRKVGTSQWVTLTVRNTTQKNVGGLQPGTCYEWQVKSYCDANGSTQSAYNALGTFCTSSSSSKLASINAESFELSQLDVFPNPFANSAVVTFSNPANEAFDFVMTDVAGKVVRKVSNVEGTELVIEKGDLPSGLYFIELRGTQVLREKVVIQ